ncbi:MAG: hypothetical protein N2508_10705 [Anaerolineae bacterium]|nr:hypothetical protein [Anaerolineae bacterium]
MDWRPVSRQVWHGVLLSLTLPLMALLALSIALLLGWNSPRPTSPPDLQLTGLPRLRAASGEVSVLLLGYPLDNFTAELEALPLSGSEQDEFRPYGYGLVYRAQSTAHYYAFAVGGDGYYGVLRQHGNDSTMLVDWQQFPHIRRGWQLNRLRITCAGPICHLYINDEYASSLEDATWVSGELGLWAQAPRDAEVTVEFTGIKIWRGDDR